MKIALACSHGGHFTEMTRLLPAFSGHDLFFVTYSSARRGEVEAIARAHFMQDIGARPWRMARAFLRVLRIFWKERPDAVVSTGAEIALPTLLWGRMLGAHTIYIESVCRTVDASLTGRLVYPFVHDFLVQWPEMLSVYGPKARYEGNVV